MLTPKSLRRWRIRLGLTQREAADAIGYSLPQYCDLEQGAERVMPISRRVALLCAAVEAGIEPLGDWPSTK